MPGSQWSCRRLGFKPAYLCSEQGHVIVFIIASMNTLIILVSFKKKNKPKHKQSPTSPCVVYALLSIKNFEIFKLPFSSLSLPKYLQGLLLVHIEVSDVAPISLNSHPYPKQINKYFIFFKKAAPYIRTLCEIRLQSQSNHRNYVFVINFIQSVHFRMNHSDPIHYKIFCMQFFFFLAICVTNVTEKELTSLGSLIALSFCIKQGLSAIMFDLELNLFIRYKGSCLFDCGAIKLPLSYQGVNNIIICHYNFLPLSCRQQQILLAK